MRQEDKDKIRKLNEELKDLNDSLLIVCQSNGLEIIDLGYIAQRVEDIKQEKRIIRARNI